MAERGGEGHLLGTPTFHSQVHPADGNLPRDSVASPSAMQTMLPAPKRRKAEGSSCERWLCWQAGRSRCLPV